jgi:hypothetical protein
MHSIDRKRWIMPTYVVKKERCIWCIKIMAADSRGEREELVIVSRECAKSVPYSYRR